MEFVLVVPVLVVALLFTIGLARMAHARHQVESLAADAARAASLERDTSMAAAAGKEIALRSMGAAGLSCADLRVSVDVSGYRPGGVVRARVTCRAELSDVAMAGLPGSRTYTAQATVPIETYRSS
jgi:Flp pilus assembly protein TadG